MDLQIELSQAIATLDSPQIKTDFQSQNEFLVVENFLPNNILNGLLRTLPSLQPAIHRNYIPRHKKGGSVSRYDLDSLAPLFGEFYRLPVWLQFLREITAEELIYCPDSDPHTYALYYYTEPGDHIEYHYDTSYYRGKRYTVLLGLVDRSSCRLEYQLYRDDPGKKTQIGALSINPGTFVLFNGDKLYHRITPLGKNEERIVLTLEYVTDSRMNGFYRFISNMKDAIAYFGFRPVFHQSFSRKN
jgi:hypothetical protein